MKPIIEILEEKISAAMTAATGQANCPAIIKPSADPKFGDYQANGVMALAKKLKNNPRKLHFLKKVLLFLHLAKKIKIEPRKLAGDVVAKLDIDDICEKPEVAGPGFINLRLKNDFISGKLLEINNDSKNSLGIDKEAKPQTVIVDFSGPNIAKQMHVGHLRSTIIGDCICRMLKSLGHTVIRQNHIGDWGTQFGMLMALLDEKSEETKKYTGVALHHSELGKLPLPVLEDFYKAAKQQYDSNEWFAEKARAAVVALHKGDLKYEMLWLKIIGWSMMHYGDIYSRLGVNLKADNERGESFYKDMLAGVVDDLKKAGLAEKSDGAICVFPDGFKTKEGEPLPLIIQKSDGAFLYATTDLAAIRYRVNELKADKIIYVTDARQKLHFEMVFATAKMAGWIKNTELVHVTFGSVLGENGKPFKTRSGENVKLKDLLDEAVKRAETITEEKNPDLPKEQKEKIANAVGIGALKYADYSNNRTSDYIFSFNKMLAMNGNTAPYMQYAYARIKSIEAKSQTDINAELANLKRPNLSEPAELDLAKYLIRYGEVIQTAAIDYRPNYLTSYLYELAQKFSAFYTNCPVLKAGPAKKATRLLLCDLTAKTIKHGLSELLGIEVVEQM